MKHITVEDAAARWEMSVRRVQDLCRMGRVPGAIRWGKAWMIPTDAVRPVDGRRKTAKEEALHTQPLVRKSPFLDMTDLYHTPGKAEECIQKLSDHPEAQALFAAEIAYSRGDIDETMRHAQYFLKNRTGFYAIQSAGMLLGLCAMWRGDLDMWQQAKKHICEAPCHKPMDADIMALSLAATDSAIRDTRDFPDWFARGRFEHLPADAHPAARVYYVKYLMVAAQDLALGNIELDGVSGLGLMRTLPYIIEPMISQMMTDRVVMAEIYLRLLCAIAYRHIGDDSRAAEHLDRAIGLCLPDRLLGPLVEHRRQLGTFLDDRLMLADPEALRRVKLLHKHLHAGWAKLHNAILKRSVSLSLSAREREVARLVAFGLTDAQVARQLYISESSVKALVRSAKNKTGVYKRAELAYYI